MPPTEAELRQAIATADAALAGAQAPYPPELFPEMARHAAHQSRRSRKTGQFTNDRRSPEAAVEPPAPPAALEASLSPENVARWSAELGFTRSARVGRVTRADD